MPKLELPEEEKMRVMMATVEIRAPRYVKTEAVRAVLDARLRDLARDLGDRTHTLSVTTRESGG